MSDNVILSHEEFLLKANLNEEQMAKWLKLGLVVPAGRTARKAALFSGSQLEIVQSVRALLALGYDEEEVARIVRKVGLPASAGLGGVVPEKLRTVGELAQDCDVNPRTIKHWEDKELLEPDARSEGGFRLYGPAIVDRCRRIIDLQNVGYTLEEIKGVKGLLDDPETLVEALKADPRPAAIEILEIQTASLKERIEHVAASAKRLDDLLKRRVKATAACRSVLSKHQKAQRDDK
ncbi:MAG: MerR family transcriptional regulator [Candidatus Eisenbacteria bacterium]|jgi:DNA-binding transcriptional MerR regulator|nr:MerR family transcriptional regulator [Candidatus Eisenbacteria bacterium]